MPEVLDGPLAKRLIAQLLNSENEWIEAKTSWFNAPGIGKYVSALGNAARLAGQPYGYLVWGVDSSGAVCGTSVDVTQTYANEPFEFWLRRRIQPDEQEVRFFEGEIDGKRLVVMSVAAAGRVPVRFDKSAFVRVGSATPPLESRPDLERRLIQALAEAAPEAREALGNARTEEVIQLIDVPAALTLLQEPVAGDDEAALERLAKWNVLDALGDGYWSIPWRGAILFARRLSDFGPGLMRKAPRTVFYEGNDRVRARSEQEGGKGYALGFAGLVEYIANRLPRNEHLRGVFREEVPVFPVEALRELIANALIHQDLAVTGAGPLIEVFDGRIEVTNPGAPLVDVNRLIDEPPRSRNERLATLMRQMRVCEERGSGIDRVVSFAEAAQLPPPNFASKSQSFVATIFAPRPFGEMTSEERVRACYQHASLRWVAGNQTMTNATLRTRFGLATDRAPQMSRLISDAVTAGLLKPADPANRSRSQAAYVPFWA